MSFVYTLKGIAPAVVTLASYISEFRKQLIDWAVRPAGIDLPSIGQQLYIDVNEEANAIWIDWLTQPGPGWKPQMRQFKLIRLPDDRIVPTDPRLGTAPIKAYVEDWEPPVAFFPLLLKPLPQEPQIRRKICGRSIRVKAERA